LLQAGKKKQFPASQAHAENDGVTTGLGNKRQRAHRGGIFLIAYDSKLLVRETLALTCDHVLLVNNAKVNHSSFDLDSQTARQSSCLTVASWDEGFNKSSTDKEPRGERGQSSK
jgi:hypothetical protein